MIQKRIFYVWGANDAYKRDMLVCIQTWRQILPDYEIIEINENSTQYFNFQEELKTNRWFRTVYNKKMWAYVADYIRVKVLYDNGGIYFDTDVSVIKSLDKFLSQDCFVGIQSSGKNSYTEPAILGAQKGNPFLGDVVKFYDDGIWKEPIYTIPQIFAKFLKLRYNIYEFPPKNQQKIIHLNDITLYPERFFIPFEFGQQFTPECIEDDTYTIHWFGGSWCRPDIEFFLKNKHLETSNNEYSPGQWRLLGVIPIIFLKSEDEYSIGFSKSLTFFRYKKTFSETQIYVLGIPLLTIKN